MKTLFAILVAVLVAASFFADYKWRQWIAARKAQRQEPVAGDPERRNRQ
jgi:hypothetical protein